MFSYNQLLGDIIIALWNTADVEVNKTASQLSLPHTCHFIQANLEANSYWQMEKKEQKSILLLGFKGKRLIAGCVYIVLKSTIAWLFCRCQ